MILKIAVNTRLLLKDRLDGIGWFTYETFKRICINNPQHQFYFLFDRPYSSEFIFSDNIHPIVVGPPTRHPILWYYWFECRLPRVLKKIKPDIFVSPDGYLSLKTNIKSFAVIHDINFVHYPGDLPLASRWYYNHFFRKFAHKARRLATVSQFSKQDLVNSYGIEPDKIDVVYNGYNFVYSPLQIEERQKVKQRHTQGSDFFVFVGSLHPRKNISNMLIAFDQMKENSGNSIKFIIIGQKFFMTDDIRKTLHGMKHSRDVIFTGRLTPIEIREIVGSAMALVLVSKFEGFGIPVIESLACGTPVIVSNVSSLPEVAGVAAIYTDPFSVDSIANAMNQMMQNTTLREDLIIKGKAICNRFSWDKTANALWNSIMHAYEC
jgi:glycosyltransferase involved in cell wall biosynthesis